MSSDDAAKAFQAISTSVASILLVLVIVAAFMVAPVTGKLGHAAWVGLTLFSVLQLFAFSLVAASTKECESRNTTDMCCVVPEKKKMDKRGPGVGIGASPILLEPRLIPPTLLPHPRLPL